MMKVRRIHKSKILVHCFAGISRSATIVLAYWIARSPAKRLDFQLDRLRKKRNIVDPNSGFIRLLADYRIRKLDEVSLHKRIAAFSLHEDEDEEDDVSQTYYF